MTGRTYMGIPREWIAWTPTVDTDACIGCGDCLETCPNGVYALNEQENKVEVVNPLNCVVLCDKCAGFCPQQAISFPDKAEIKHHIGQLLRATAGQQAARGDLS
jgi:NAD-dependent dihydropyrimidine dehydrogenase PreA subunit